VTFAGASGIDLGFLSPGNGAIAPVGVQSLAKVMARPAGRFFVR
jgi:hypothetical protein